jgi:hypothetical protein
MTDKEVEEELERLLMSDEMWEIAKKSLTNYMMDQIRYGGCFQKLPKPGEKPRKRYGWSGEEI